MKTNSPENEWAAARRGTGGRVSTDGFLVRVQPLQPSEPEPVRATEDAAVNSPVQPAMNRQDFPLPRYQAPKRPKRIVQRRRVLKRALLQAVVLSLVLVVGLGGFFSWKAYAKLHKVFRGTSTVAALSAKPVAPNLLDGEGDGRVNILLLGVGGAGHEGPDLTDTIVVLSVDPVNKTAAFLSVPRDLWVKQPVNYFGSYQKINAAYESGKYKYLGKMDQSNTNDAAVEAGFASIDSALKDVLGIKINYHLLVDFQAFRQAIDTVGGVTVDVKDQLYDPTMAWENNGNPVLAAVGVQQMDGKKALLYARSRETSSDFARSERQRQILLALKDKVLTAGTLSNPAKIDGLMDAFGDNVFSDLSTQGAQRLYEIVKGIDDTKIASIGLSEPPNSLVTTDHVGNTSVVRPRAGFNNYTDIQNYVHAQLADGYILKEKAGVMVLAPTKASADTEAAQLKTYGYVVTGTGATPTPGFGKPVVVDLSGGKNPYTQNYLENRFGVKAVRALPSGVVLPPSSAQAQPEAKFVIIMPK